MLNHLLARATLTILLPATAHGAVPSQYSTLQSELASWKAWLKTINDGFVSQQVAVKHSEGICANTLASTYPYDCVTETLVTVSVCKSSTNTEGLQPLPAGYSCSTDGTYSPTGTWEKDGVSGNTSDCTQLEADFAAQMSWDTFNATYSGSHNWGVPSTGNPNFYQAMFGSTSAAIRAALAGGHFAFPSNMNCGLYFEPIVGEQSSFTSYDGAAQSSTTASTVSKADVYIYNPTTLASASPSLFTHGKVHVLGGNSAGELVIHQVAPGMKAEVSGITSTGTLSVIGIEDAFIADTTSSGLVNITDSKPVLVNVQNSGTVLVSGGEAKLYEVTNAAGGTVSFLSGQATLDSSTNAGTITMMGGSATGTAIVNSGTITINSGLIDLTFTSNAGGTITVADGVTGTISLLAGGAPGTFTFPSTGLTISGFSVASTSPASPPPLASPPLQTATSPQPLPPSPSTPPPPSAPEMTQIQNSFTASGTVSEYDANKIGQIQAAVAKGAGVNTTDVHIDVTAGSVVITSTIITEAATASQTVSTLNNGIFSNTTSLETALSSEGVTVTVSTISAPTIISFSPPTAPPTTPPADKGGDDDNIGGIIGGAVGGSCGLLFGLGGYYVYKKKQQTKVVSTTA